MIRNERPDQSEATASPLSEVVERVRKGTRFTVIYRSRLAFQIVPVDDTGDVAMSLDDDPLYNAPAVGPSKDRSAAAEYDSILYGR